MASDDGDGGPDMSLFDFGDSDDEKQSKTSVSNDPKAILKRHRQEEQSIRTDAKAKLREIPRGDRAAKQAVDEELEKALEDMRNRHAEELEGLEGVEALDVGVARMNVGSGASGGGSSSGSKGGKKKTKKQKAEEEERAREQRIADHHAGAGPSERDVEMGKLSAILTPLGLAVHEIPADGHCLYRSLAHELQQSGEQADFLQCRKEIASYMRAHPDDFIPYLDDGCTDISAYCDVVEQSNEWGGQLEITALAHARKRAITVFSADAPPLCTGEEYEENGPALSASARSSLRECCPSKSHPGCLPLLSHSAVAVIAGLAYHRHYYGLGEHYNAVVPS